MKEVLQAEVNKTVCDICGADIVVDHSKDLAYQFANSKYFLCAVGLFGVRDFKLGPAQKPADLCDLHLVEGLQALALSINQKSPVSKVKVP